MTKLDLIMLTAILLFFLNSLWKWSKILLVIISLEAVSVFILASLLGASSGYFSLLFIIFAFFVSEALILLSSLYSALRHTGSMNSSLMI